MSAFSRQAAPASTVRCRGRRTALGLLGAAALFPAVALPASAWAAGTPLSAKVDVIDPRLINVKFKDDTSVAARAGKLDLASTSAQARLDALLGAGKAAVAPGLEVDSGMLDARRELLEAKGKDVPDLTAWVRVKLDASVDPKATIAALLADPLVEYAYAVPEVKATTLSSVDQNTVNTVAANTLGVAGLNIYGAATVPGALGSNVDVVDLEYEANFAHEDLIRSPATVDAWYADPTPSFDDEYHGTAVLGIVAAKRDGNGIDGIAPNARAHLASITNESGLPSAPGTSNDVMADVMYASYQRMAPGSVFLVEVGGTAAIEYDPLIADLIRTATAAGVITVEAASNGSADYNSPAYANTSLAPNPGAKDTGAIMVGAGSVPGCSAYSADPTKPRTRLYFSGYGTRVDVQGPGHCVAAPSSKFGGVSRGEFGTDKNTGYTTNFAGTSSASANIAGVVAALSGAYQERVGVPLTPALARTALKTYGVKAQNTTVDPGKIGPLPNLTAVVNAIAVPDTTAPTRPGEIGSVNYGYKIAMGWPASTDDVGVARYEITRTGSGVIESTRDTKFTDYKTTPGTFYQYSVTAIDAQGNRSQARALNIAAGAAPARTDVTIPKPPALAEPAPNSGSPSTKIDLSWSGATDDVAVHHYEVRRNGVLLAASSNSATTSFIDDTVEPGTYYRYEIVAVDAAGNRSTPSAPRGVVSGGPRGDVIAPSLAGGVAWAANAKYTTLMWAPATDAVGGITYEIQRRTSPPAEFTVIEQTANAAYNDTSVASNTAYTYKIVAIDGAGNRSAPLVVTTTSGTYAASTDTTAPAATSAPSVSLNASNKPQVAWNAATDDVAVGKYVVRRDGLYVAASASASTLAFIDANAKTGRNNSYSVVVLDTSNNRSTESAARGITPAP